MSHPLVLQWLILICSLTACIPIRIMPSHQPIPQASANLDRFSPPRSRSPGGWIGLGKMDIIDGDYTQARFKFEQALILEPHNEEAAFYLAGSLASLGEIEKSLEGYLALLPSPKFMTPEEVYEKLGLTYSYLGRCDNAGEAYAKVNQTMPYCPRSFEADNEKAAGDNAFQKGAFNSARTHYEKALALQPNFVEVQYNLASTLAETENYEKALALYLDLEHDAPPINMLSEHIATTYSYLQQCERAGIYYEKAKIINYTCPLARRSFSIMQK